MKNILRNKRGAVSLLLIGVVVVIALALAGTIKLGEITGAVGSGGYIERPVFSYVKCEPIGGLVYSVPASLATNGQWIARPSVSSSYNVKIKTPSVLIVPSSPSLTMSGRRVMYAVCNSQVLSQDNCRIYNSVFYSGNENAVSDVRANEYVWMQYQKMNALTLYKWVADSGATYQVGFVPYGLREYNVLSGSSNPINPNDCDVSVYNSKNNYVKSEDISKLNAISPRTNENVFQPEEVRWYVAGYVSSASPSFVLNYQGQEAWCRNTGTSGEIYKINKVTLGSGTYKIASPDWSDYLGSVTCCPKSTLGDKVCNSNFQWETIAGSECGAFKSCGSPNWVPYSTQQIIKYSCVNGYCKSEIKDVECASNYDCKDSNQVCNLNTHTCVNANVNLQGQVIKTIADNKEDCEKDGGKWITQTTEKGNLLTWLGITKPKTIVTEFCDYGGFNWVKLIVTILIIIVAIFLLIRFFPYIRVLLKKIPIIGQVIP